MATVCGALVLLASEPAHGDPLLPNIPANQYNVLNFGARGDGVSNNTTAIQNTINAAAATGGTVEIPAGTYLSGPFTLASRINLQIDSGATLKMLPIGTFTNFNGGTDHFIYASNVSDVEISGSGTIDGNGAGWWSPLAATRPYMVYFNGGCSRVLIQNITLQNPPKMHIVFKGVDFNITIQGITINTTAGGAKNTDGIDLVGTSCLIQNCTINAGDDNIAIGSSAPSAISADILVTNCTFGIGHGVSIGSNTAGGVSNLTVTSCSFNGTDYGIRMKSDNAGSSPGAGGGVENLLYSNITMTNIVHGAIVIYSYYNEFGTPIGITPAVASTQAVGFVAVPIWRNITISNVTATVASGGIAGIIWGRKEALVTNVTLSKVSISANSTFDIYNARDIRLIDSQITVPGANTLNLYNAQVTVTNTTASANPVTLGGLATPPTNNVLAFFNGRATITDTNMLGTGSITLGGSTLTFSQASASFSNALRVITNSTMAVTSGNNTFSGALSGPGRLTLNLPANSVLTVQGNCSGFTGSLAITNSGTLRLNQGTNQWGDANAAFDAGALGTIDNRSTTSITAFLGALTGGSGSKLQGSSQTGPGVDTYVIGGLNSGTTFAGTIANGTSGATPHTVAVTKIGSGAFTLSGNNSYGGGTTVSNGTLLVNNIAGSGTGTGAVAVVSGATLGGSGIVGGPVTVNGTLAPGNGVGTLAISNSLVVNGGAVLEYALGTTSDQTVVRGNLTLDGTLDITDAGGFTNGTYTLFRYGGTLTHNSLTIGTTPNTGLGYTVDISSNGYVKLIVGAMTAPKAAFTGKPTNGAVPLVVTFSDDSTGTITNRFWDFGDGATTNTTAGNLTHTYTNVASFGVSLTVSGPLGVDTLSQSSYITATYASPVITAGATVSNAALQVGNKIVVVAGDTNVFSIEATDPEGMSYQWSFGDGVTNAWSSSNTVEHAYTTNCGPYQASVTISNGVGLTTTSNFTIVVACQLDLAKVAMKLNFARTNADNCTIRGSFELPFTPSFAGEQATLDIGGASLTFTLPSKGSALNGRSKFSTPTLNKKTGQWKLNVSFKNGFWQTDWANYSMINSNVSKPGAVVSDLPVILLLDTEAFMATTNLHYTATQDRSGTAK
jgi:autotransporter-associated beta strand protein